MKNKHWVATDPTSICATGKQRSACSKYKSPVSLLVALLFISSSPSGPLTTKSATVWLAHPSAMTKYARHVSAVCSSTTPALKHFPISRTLSSWWRERVGYQKLTLSWNARSRASESDSEMNGRVSEGGCLSLNGGRACSKSKMEMYSLRREGKSSK